MGKDTTEIDGANCRCPTGETQSCVHIAGLLLTLADVTQTACTSQVCIWSRLAMSSKAQFLTELDFRLASSTGYKPYTREKLDASTLVQELQASGLAVGFGEYIAMEQDRLVQQRNVISIQSTGNSNVLRDPFDYLLSRTRTTGK